MVALKSILISLALGVEVLAAVPAGSSVICATKLGTISVAKPPKATTTIVNKLTVIKKVIQKVNVVVIPVAKTTTVKETTTILDTVTAGSDTETATETSTSTETTTSTTTTTTTETFTFTIFAQAVPITTTVDAPEGFARIVPTIDVLSKRDNFKRLPRTLTLPGEGAKEYVQRIDCTKRVPQYTTKTVTTKVQGARITLKAVTKTTKTIVTVHDTTTVYGPDVSETTTTEMIATFRALARRVATTTLTQTATVQTEVPAFIQYDACKADNILLRANGGGLFSSITNLSSDQQGTYLGDLSPSQCCTECMLRPNCRVSLNRKGKCYVYLAQDTKICANNAQPVWGRYKTTAGSPGAVPDTLWSNGPCGQIVNGGVESGK